MKALLLVIVLPFLLRFIVLVVNVLKVEDRTMYFIRWSKEVTVLLRTLTKNTLKMYVLLVLSMFLVIKLFIPLEWSLFQQMDFHLFLLALSWTFAVAASDEMLSPMKKKGESLKEGNE